VASLSPGVAQQLTPMVTTSLDTGAIVAQDVQFPLQHLPLPPAAPLASSPSSTGESFTTPVLMLVDSPPHGAALPLMPMANTSMETGQTVVLDALWRSQLVKSKNFYYTQLHIHKLSILNAIFNANLFSLYVNFYHPFCV